jgi:hypothetical protein
MTDMIQTMMLYTTIVVATNAAIRKNATMLDGWYVWLCAGGITLLVCFTFEPTGTLEECGRALKMSVGSFIFAVGGDSWVGKLIGKFNDVKEPKEHIDDEYGS